MLEKPKLALSFDVEATGERPGEHRGSMVMLGVVAVRLSVLENENFSVLETNQSDWVFD